MTDDQPSRMTPEIGVIGTASLDVLHLGEKTVSTVGGAGLYTALAAAKAGAAVVFCAPRPAPMPAALQPVAARVSWNGPVIAPDALPRLEIAHHGEGRATLLAASWGAESQLTPALLPEALQHAALVHIAALSTARAAARLCSGHCRPAWRTAAAPYIGWDVCTPGLWRDHARACPPGPRRRLFHERERSDRAVRQHRAGMHTRRCPALRHPWSTGGAGHRRS